MPSSTDSSVATGKLIFLNGASSSGKSSIARELIGVLPAPFLFLSFDHWMEGEVLPLERIRRGDFAWSEIREAVFLAFHNSVRSALVAGCNVVAEHIIENRRWCDRLARYFGDSDVFLVAVVCPLEVLEERERKRGDRPIGDAARDAATCFTFCRHDLLVDSQLPPSQNARLITDAWLARDQVNLVRFT